MADRCESRNQADEAGDCQLEILPTPAIPSESEEWRVRYIDSGTRHPDQALGTWLAEHLSEKVVALRVQSGFFSSEVLPALSEALKRLAEHDHLVRVVVGSNDGGTLKAHLDDLANLIGIPRAGAGLGVVYYSGAYFHPKTVHLRRTDGSEAAYVGSANLTLPGVAAKHVEAGILLDTLAGDDPALLANIRAATDAWFEEERPGFELIEGPEDIQHLLEEGIVRAVAPPRPPKPAGGGGQVPARPSLAPLITFIQQPQPQPQPPPHPMPDPQPEDLPEVPEAWQALPSVQRTPPYPPYVFFVPDAVAPAQGTDALTGMTLGAATGLIIKLSRDNDRHWREAPGTANISIPVSTATTLRFGVYGERARPRAEFELAVRYVDDDVVMVAPRDTTNIMSFGFTPGDTGHADLRLVLPRPPINDLRQRLTANGMRLPQAQDLAVLEWPTPAAPEFRMTVTNPDSALGATIREIWQEAASDGQLASRGACWLPAGVAPAW